MKVEFHHTREVPDDKLRFAVIMARTGCGWLFVRHRARQTWEIPGGHREGYEPIRDTAARELYEETGASASSLVPICVYSVIEENETNHGVLFFAEVQAMGDLPDSEIAEVCAMEKMPEHLTYPDIQPALFNAGIEYALSWDYAMSDVF